MTIYSLDVLLCRFRTSGFSMSCSNCCCLTCVQISQEADKVVWYSHLFKNFPQFLLIRTVKCFNVVNEAENWKWKLLSPVWLFVTPWIIESMEFSRPEYWSGEPFPSPGDLPSLGIEPRSPALEVDYLPAELQGKPRMVSVLFSILVYDLLLGSAVCIPCHIHLCAV